MLTAMEKTKKVRLHSEYRTFLESFFIEALSGKLLDIIQSKESCDREKTIEYVSFTIRVSLEALIDAAVMAGKAEHCVP